MPETKHHLSNKLFYKCQIKLDYKTKHIVSGTTAGKVAAKCVVNPGRMYIDVILFGQTGRHYPELGQLSGPHECRLPPWVFVSTLALSSSCVVRVASKPFICALLTAL